MILLLDIGNTHTHLGLANDRAVVRSAQIPTRAWQAHTALPQIRRFIGRSRVSAVAACSVVPAATAIARQKINFAGRLPWFELTAETARAGIDIRYPKPSTIGPDRLANAIAARSQYGAPCLAIDFGTAVTFDVVDPKGAFVGGVIAPGMALMTGYLHEKTALLPQVKLGPVRSVIGRSTAEAMRIAAVCGFAGLVRELIHRLKQELGGRRLPVVATGGYARRMARELREITAVAPRLTLEGLRLARNLNLET